MDRQELERLIQFPRETLGTELKRWFDPSTPEGIGRIARACIALWNNNGGCLIIGIQDDGQPDPAAPANVQDLFHPDVIQGIVSKYASEPIPVTVEFVERDGRTYPVVCVPSGVRTPVAAKAELPHPQHTSAAPRAPLVRLDTVYIRTLNANNIVSSAPARSNDWRQIVRNCFDNREADVGGFIRRQLATVDPRQLRLAVKSLRPAPLASEVAVKLLDYGRAQFMAETTKRKIPIPGWGTLEAAIVIDGQVPPQTADKDWLFRIRGSAPEHSSLSFWADLSAGKTKDVWPYYVADGIETLLVELDKNAPFGEMLDFWRMDPAGKFYCLRAILDDTVHPKWQKTTPGTTLEPLYQIGFIAEILSVCLSFANTMGCDEANTALECAFRWTGLNGRLLADWSKPHDYRASKDVSRDDTKTTQIRVPMDTPLASLSPFVHDATKQLFALFGGDVYPFGRLDARVREVLSQRH